MFSSHLLEQAGLLVARMRERELKLATAESCTGGLIAALLTEIAGSSDVLERGFVTYSNAAKCEMLGIPANLIAEAGVVSREVAIAMARGALAHSRANVSVAVTGIAGPGGGTVSKPVGLVHVAAARKGGTSIHRECRFGPLSRGEIRLRTVAVALELVRETVDVP